MMAISNAPWGSVTAASYPDAGAYCSACLIDMNPSGQSKAKENCKLPVRMPNGDLNRNGVHAAAAALAGSRGGVNAPPMMKRMAARKLMRMYAEMHEEPPESLRRMAQ